MRKLLKPASVVSHHQTPTVVLRTTLAGQGWEPRAQTRHPATRRLKRPKLKLQIAPVGGDGDKADYACGPTPYALPLFKKVTQNPTVAPAERQEPNNHSLLVRREQSHRPFAGIGFTRYGPGSGTGRGWIRTL